MLSLAAALRDFTGADQSDDGFVERPFGPSADTRFVFESRSFSYTLEQLVGALRRREGIMVVTGPTGIGKTMLVRAMLKQVVPPTLLSVIRDPRLSVEDLLAQMLDDFGAIPDDEKSRTPEARLGSRYQLVTRLQKFLAGLAPSSPRGVIVIDEAHHLQPDVLGQIRLLSNCESDTAKLLQFVLVGQPELGERLDRSDRHQLDQRIDRRWDLQPLARDEVRPYIEHRLRIAQGRAPEPPRRTGTIFGASASVGPRFTPSAIRRVAVISRGIPRVINMLSEQALEICEERHTHTIDRAVIRAAARQLTPKPTHILVTRLQTLGLCAMLLLLIAGWPAWRWLSGRGASLENSRPAATAVSPASATFDAGAAGTIPIAESVNVIVASLRSERRARTIAAAIQQAGLPAFTRTQSDGWQMIVVGPYVSVEEAQATQASLVTQGFPDARIVGETP